MEIATPIAIFTNKSLPSVGSVVNITQLESNDSVCKKELALVASESLNHTVLVCIATGHSHPICSLPVVLAVRGMYT